MVRRVVTLIITIAAVYGAAVGYLYLFQRSFVFQPGGTLATPQEQGLADVEVVTLTMADGTVLTTWYAEPAEGHPTLLYFHGNALNISDRAARFRQVIESGFGLLAVSYRGYPGSGGAPSEAAFLSDGLEIHDWLAARADTIVLHGESLGTATAIYLATERAASAVILEAPFTAAVDIARETYPWVPVSLLMHDQFRSRDRIGAVDEPVLIVHGARDMIVPVTHGQQLYDAAGEPKRFVSLSDAGHQDLWAEGLWTVVLDFLSENGVAPG